MLYKHQNSRKSKFAIDPQNVWAARHNAKRAALHASWDARHETVRPFRADAAIDMVPSLQVDATARALCELAL